VIRKELLELVRMEFVLSWHGVHGEPHRARVRENSLRLARLTGARLQVVELFALLHDSKRLNDRRDPGHGARAVTFARALRGSLIQLPDEEFELLAFACEYHADGWTEAEITVQTCWDADRLDLGRVGIRPDPSLLCTAAAREPAMIEWAFLRSQQRYGAQQGFR